MGKGEEKVEVGDSALVVGGIDAFGHSISIHHHDRHHHHHHHDRHHHHHHHHNHHHQNT